MANRETGNGPKSGSKTSWHKSQQKAILEYGIFTVAGQTGILRLMEMGRGQLSKEACDCCGEELTHAGMISRCKGFHFHAWGEVWWDTWGAGSEVHTKARVGWMCRGKREMGAGAKLEAKNGPEMVAVG